MKNRILIGISVLFLGLVGCTNKDTFVISGQINQAGNIKVVSLYEGDRKLDSVYLNESNKFKFERPASQGRLVSLRVGTNKYDLIVQPGEQIDFNTNLQDSPEKYKVEGSDLSKAIQKFAVVRNRRDFLKDSLQADFSKKTANASAIEIDALRYAYLQKFSKELKDYTQKAVKFSEEHADLAGFYAISTLDPEIAEAEIIAYADKIKDQFQENGYVQQFKLETAKLKQLAIGQPAPQFDSFTVNNKKVSLVDYKGKYTLVDFWASWCAPCREENPNIVRLYHAYKAKGFDVLGVSLDNNPGPWMRAIEDDKLAWTQVSDLQAWGSPIVGLYRLKAIPTSYLLDPNGLILAKNLRGAELENFLKETLK